MADIFISYSREDRSRVAPIAKALEKQGWSVFWDRTIPAGKTWRQVIGDALETARSVIVVWSKTSVDSRWVQEEADRGLERNILIPVLIDNVKPPLGFGTVQAADLISWEPTKTLPEFEKLITDISAILGPSLLEVEEAERTSEAERKHKQEEGRKRREEEQQRRETARKAKEERIQTEAEAKHKADVDTTLDKTELWNKLVKIIAETLSVDISEIVPEASFVDDLGADELDLVELVMSFEEEFDLEISDEDSALMQTVKDAFVYVCGKP